MKLETAVKMHVAPRADESMGHNTRTLGGRCVLVEVGRIESPAAKNLVQEPTMTYATVVRAAAGWNIKLRRCTGSQCQFWFGRCSPGVEKNPVHECSVRIRE